MPLDSADALLELADEDAVTEHSGVVLGQRLPKAADSNGELVELASMLRAQCTQLSAHRTQLGAHLPLLPEHVLQYRGNCAMSAPLPPLMASLCHASSNSAPM